MRFTAVIEQPEMALGKLVLFSRRGRTANGHEMVEAKRPETLDLTIVEHRSIEPIPLGLVV